MNFDQLIEPFLEEPPTPSSDFEFMDPHQAPMKLCAICKSLNMESLVEHGRKNQRIDHQPSYVALLLSAVEGCEMCSLLLSAILTNDNKSVTKRELYEGFRNCKSRTQIWIPAWYFKKPIISISYGFDNDEYGHGEVYVQNYIGKGSVWKLLCTRNAEHVC